MPRLDRAPASESALSVHLLRGVLRAEPLGPNRVADEGTDACHHLGEGVTGAHLRLCLGGDIATAAYIAIANI
eukprot:CAMPEP_0198237262 /NCGR_PEP_ID=MMETSP1446-20131203/3110_1 /TAXON_ID=1461542 ORGANISM="Unidentified sp, Strain CCMP2111" /NCGR_SAMPLE_ID=MMETSP1446 /ASSEMBLY_ACC=CAM_ASM_001112 /LENGTH=72 /DNA_ID=CAMNT_0043919355 /DNA_START=277 /DNA_END=495 /DNA_ORIENTATION=+